MTQIIQVVQLPHSEGLPLPSYAHETDAGMDLMAAISEPLVLLPRSRALVPTGLRVALPSGHEIQIRPRSGLALRHGIVVANSPGTVDESFRGEIQVILLNTGDEQFVVERGMKIAQAVLAPVTHGQWCKVAVLPDTERGAGGFGSTGTS